MSGREYAELLREAAGFFELHPDMPVTDVYSSLAVLYEDLGEDAREVATIAQREGFTPQPNPTGGLVIWERRCGHGTLCFLLPSGESSKAN
jgi:hypothetical protein